MADTPSTAVDSRQYIEWMWKSNPNPWSKTEPEEWSHYSDLENLIIEEAYSNNQAKAELDGHYIDLLHKVQISSNSDKKQRPIKRVERSRENKHLRQERFMDTSITSQRAMGGEYGWVSTFICEVRQDLGLEKKQLPSKESNLIPILVEKAACGIIEEGKQIGQQCKAKQLAKMLTEKKDKGMNEVWECCAYLYSLESFLYRKLNDTMRLIGDKEHEQLWRSKISTLGPFCLLLWDDPINKRVKINMTLYRGAKLKPEQVAIYEEMAKNPNEYRSFQAFTSCSRNREKATKFGNVLFIIKVLAAFIADISSLSQYPDEEEELITPGACFRVRGFEYNQKTEKNIITLELRQRFSKNDQQEVQNQGPPNTMNDEHPVRRRFLRRLRSRARALRAYANLGLDDLRDYDDACRRDDLDNDRIRDDRDRDRDDLRLRLADPALDRDLRGLARHRILLDRLRLHPLPDLDTRRDVLARHLDTLDRAAADDDDRRICRIRRYDRDGNEYS